MFSWELSAWKSNETHWSNLKQMSRHSSVVNTTRIKNVVAPERRFPVYMRFWIRSSLRSNAFPKIGSQAWTWVKIWRSTTKTAAKHNLAMLVLSCDTNAGYGTNTDFIQLFVHKTFTFWHLDWNTFYVNEPDAFKLSFQVNLFTRTLMTVIFLEIIYFQKLTWSGETFFWYL